MDNPALPTANPIQSVSGGSASVSDSSPITHAAADSLFADYRQRRAQKTVKTQTAALLLWVQYLGEVGAASELLAAATDWALIHFDQESLDVMAEYAQLQHVSLPITYSAHYCQYVPAAWQGVTWGLVEGFVKWLLQMG